MAKIINVIYNEYTNTVRDGITNRAILVKRSGGQWSLDMLDISDREPANVAFVARLAKAYAFNHSVQWNNDGERLALFLDHYANGGEFECSPNLMNNSMNAIPLCCSSVEQNPVNVISSNDAATHAVLFDALINSNAPLLNNVRAELGADLDADTLKYCFDINLGSIGGFRVWVNNELIGSINVKAVQPSDCDHE